MSLRRYGTVTVNCGGERLNEGPLVHRQYPGLNDTDVFTQLHRTAGGNERKPSSLSVPEMISSAQNCGGGHQGPAGGMPMVRSQGRVGGVATPPANPPASLAIRCCGLDTGGLQAVQP
ncbi:hypothetical protein AAFF_G00306580 [Aldrovandia affinis]|uniref:Uncharacterized protein n=1 Tax=Aldrovandia affinis TaxID=143900 RepID=A0AAD7R8V0_9TELE|nr:hypothetical protein AAFF_G00306580 [Aldrovandia affinis]